jgi:hypothetical protein
MEKFNGGEGITLPCFAGDGEKTVELRLVGCPDKKAP